MSQRNPMPSIPGGGVDLSHLANRPQGGQAPGAQASGAGARAGGHQSASAVDVPSLVMDISDSTFEQAAQLSGIVPVVISLWSENSEPAKELNPVLEKVTRDLGGLIMLAKVDVDANPQLTQAFGPQAIPTVVALVGGRPVPLFQGPLAEAQIRDFMAQLLQLAEQQGVTGRVAAPDATGDGTPVPPPAARVPEAHIPAMEAAERGDYAGAIAEWQAVLQKAPADQAAKEALAQMKLLLRLQGQTVDGVRTAAADQPDDLNAQMLVADLDLSGGHIEDAFLRLLELFEKSDDTNRAIVRTRLLELFEVVGQADPRVNAARGRLASLMF